MKTAQPMGLVMFTVYERPRDYPDEFVVRRSILRGGSVFADADLWGRGKTIREARASIPDGLHCLPRQDADDPVIVECWL